MFLIVDKRDGKYGVKDTDDNTVEYYTSAKILAFSKQVKIFGVHYDYKKQKDVITVTKNISSFISSFNDLVEYSFQRCLRQYVSDWDSFYSNVYEEKCNGGINSTWEVRFLGGFGAWNDGSEDICDAENMSKEVRKLVIKACEEYYKNTGIFVSFCTGEKAWTYFNFN